MRRVLVAIAALAVALPVVGCARPSGRSVRPPPLLHVLTAGEIALTGARDAHAAIEAARPAWLAAGGPLAATDRVQVYVEETRYNDVLELRRIRVSAIREIQYMNGPEATSRYGAGHTGGALIVRLIRG